MFAPLFGPIIAAIIAVFGWWVAHHFNMSRDRANRHRDTIVQYLLDAYRRLEAVTNCQMTKEQEVVLESAIADIQLLGSPAQIQETNKFIEEFTSNKSASLDGLLDLLRNDLRKKLGLAVVSGRKVLRIKQGNGNPQTGQNSHTATG